VGENKKGNLLPPSVPEGIDAKNAGTDGPVDIELTEHEEEELYI
jgi:hypothetical protein